jgi:hypothetical protein
MSAPMATRASAALCRCAGKRNSGNIDFTAIFGLRGGLLGAETPGFPMLNLTPGFAQNRSQMTTLVAVWLKLPID